MCEVQFLKKKFIFEKKIFSKNLTKKKIYSFLGFINKEFFDFIKDGGRSMKFGSKFLVGGYNHPKIYLDFFWKRKSENSRGKILFEQNLEA